MSYRQRLLARGDLPGGAWIVDRARVAGDPAAGVLQAAILARVGCPAWSRRCVESVRSGTENVFTV